MSLFPVFLIEVGGMAKQYIEKGLLVPDHVITRLMMLELENRRDQHWLLDGESNLWVSWISFVSQVVAQSTEPHWPGLGWISVDSLSFIEFYYCSSFDDAFCFHD